VNRSDAARPMPLPAPVMMTDLPSRRPMGFSLAFVWRRVPRYRILNSFSNSIAT
jgi:hypothetical protein